MLRHLPTTHHPDLLVGTEHNDDAAVWRPDGTALVATADFFTPIVDDPKIWGQIAAANAVSDVYAMGGKPLFALNLVAWPRDELPLEILSEVLIGGQESATNGGWVVAGGHTVDGPEPMYGMSLVGEIDENAALTNSGGALRGHALVLTKPLGTGLLATALKRSDPEAIQDGGRLQAIYTAGVREMTRLRMQPPLKLPFKPKRRPLLMSPVSDSLDIYTSCFPLVDCRHSLTSRPYLGCPVLPISSKKVLWPEAPKEISTI